MCRRRNPFFRRIGWAIIILGMLVFFAIVFPQVFWWLLLAAALIGVGFIIIRCY